VELWPNTDPDAWSDVAEGLQDKANELEEDAVSIKRAADSLYGDCSGAMIDAMHGACIRQSQALMDQFEQYVAMAEAVNRTPDAMKGRGLRSS
jgi:hypothetical protein